ncbi:ABC transporter substrate-binding protein [Microbacterium sp. NPDC058342]|uniref:ABC transporter substrate-binding protein n=1 Tax=Microbacterium sp. NPDC058342 TaxID=3346454 RepID=UPI00365B89EC
MTFYRTRLHTTAAVVAVGALALLTGCSSPAGGNTSDGPIDVPGASDDANAYMNELYDKAKEGGQNELVLYGPGPSSNRAMNEVFMARFPGITVIPQDQPDAQSLTKLDTEAESGNRIADIYIGGESPQAAAKPNICTPADVRTAPDDFEIETLHDGRLTYFALRYFGFVYNTDMVDAEDAPKSWHDLLDPQWKGKITVGDPTVPGGIRYILTSLMLPENEATWGEDYVAKLAEQDVQIAQSEAVVSADVASGRFPIGIGVFQGYYQSQKNKGAHLEMVFPLEDGGNYMARSAMCLIKDAPNADVAQLYINWMYSPEGQKTLAEKDNSYGWTPEAPGPAGAPPLGELKRLPFSNPDPEFNAPYFEFINEAFKK